MRRAVCLTRGADRHALALWRMLPRTAVAPLVNEDKRIAGGMSLEEARKIFGLDAAEVDKSKLREVSSLSYWARRLCLVFCRVVNGVRYE